MITFGQIRDRIQPMRTDKKDRQAQMAFQVGARRLASETFGLQEIVIFTMPAGAFAVEPYSQASQIVLGDGSSLTIDPTTLTYSDPTDNPWEKETVTIFKAEFLSSDGSWRGLHLYNQQLLGKMSHKIEPGWGTMRAYTSDQGRFRPNIPPAADTQVRAVVAYQPTGDFDEVCFSHQFEDALVEGALAHYLRLPGKGRDLAAAADADGRFLSMASGLRGMALIGDQGYVRGSTSPRKHERWGRFMSHDTLEP